MFPTIFLRSLASNPFSPTNSRPVDVDSSNLEDQERWRVTRVAHVLILGNGIASHWVSLWIFADGDVWSVELSAEDPRTGERLVKSRCSMKFLHRPPAHQRLSQVAVQCSHLDPLCSSFQKQKTSRPSREVEVIKDAVRISCREKTCEEQVQKVVHQIWPLEKSETKLHPKFFDDIFSADDPVNRLEEILNSSSASDIRDLAEVLLIAFHEVAWHQGWSPEYRLAKISEEMDCLWLGSVPTEDEVNSVITSHFIFWDVMKGPQCFGLDFHIQEQCFCMDALWPMLLLFDQHLLNMIVRLLDELKEAQRKSWSPEHHFRIIWRAIYFLKGLFPHSWPPWYLIFQFFHGGIEWLRHFTTQRWSQLKTLPAQNLMDMTEHLLSCRFGMGEGSSCDELRPVHEEILAARAELVFMKESILRLLEDARCHEDRAKAVRRAKKPAWRTLPEKIICEQRRRVLKLFQELLHMQHDRVAILQKKQHLQQSMDMLQKQPVSSCKRGVEEILINYLEQYNYEILTWSICVGETSPECLQRKAERNPVVGTSYDVFFNNCQLYILHLLVKQYKLIDAHLHLPWNIGAIAAGPVLLIMEAFFIWVFEVVREKVHIPVDMAFLGFHVRLPAQLAATVYGFVWIALEINLSVSYLLKLLPKAASSNLVLGEILALVILLFVLWSFDIPPFTIPVVSFALDLLLVSLAGKVNIIDRDPLLFLLNVWMTFLSSSAICILQLLYGWPMLLSLECLLLFAFVIQRCFV